MSMIADTPIVTEEDSVLVPLGSKKYPGLFATVDKADLPLIEGYAWRAMQTQTTYDRAILYASTRQRGSQINGPRYPYMHRVILGLTDPRVKVDHVNHNGLDNRRCNLRITTHQQNIFNRRGNLFATSQFKGVGWHKDGGKWQARIRIDGKMISLGLFSDEKEAALSYDEKARELFGEYAYLNFPDEVPE